MRVRDGGQELLVCESQKRAKGLNGKDFNYLLPLGTAAETYGLGSVEFISLIR